MVRYYQQMKCQKYISEQLLAAIRSVKECGMKVAIAAKSTMFTIYTL